MHAIERLRYVARSGDVDATELACEAAYALAGLARDRRALVLACRRLLEFHPRSGPLWWVTAHCLVADDLRATAASLVERLENDETIDELFALPDSQATVACATSRTIVRGLSERTDLAVRMVGDHYGLRSSMRYFADSLAPVQGFVVDEIDDALDGVDIVVVETLAAASAGYLFDPTARALTEHAIAIGLPLWVVAGVGRVLPSELFAALVARSGIDGVHVSQQMTDEVRAGLIADDGPTDRVIEADGLLPVATASVVVTPLGPRTPKVVFHRSAAISHQRCPVPTELLVAFGVAG